MEIIKISLSLHLVGIVLWVGGMLILTRAMAVAAGTETPQALKAWFSKAYFRYILTGLGLVLFTGLFQMAWVGVGYYMTQGWFHTKLTLVLIMLIVTALAGVKANAQRDGQSVKAATFMALHGLTGIVLLGAIFLTILGRVSSIGG